MSLSGVVQQSRRARVRRDPVAKRRGQPAHHRDDVLVELAHRPVGARCGTGNARTTHPMDDRLVVGDPISRSVEQVRPGARQCDGRTNRGKLGAGRVSTAIRRSCGAAGTAAVRCRHRLPADAPRNRTAAVRPTGQAVNRPGSGRPPTPSPPRSANGRRAASTRPTSGVRKRQRAGRSCCFT